MKTYALSFILIMPLAALAETDQVTTVLCRPVLKVQRPGIKSPGATPTTCYDQAKKLLAHDKKNPGNLAVYLELAKKDKTVDKACVDFFRDAASEITKAGLQDDFTFEEMSKDKGESRATLDEAFYFYNECETLEAKTKKSATPAPADEAASAAKAK